MEIDKRLLDRKGLKLLNFAIIQLKENEENRNRQDEDIVNPYPYGGDEIMKPKQKKKIQKMHFNLFRQKDKECTDYLTWPISMWYAKPNRQEDTIVTTVHLITYVKVTKEECGTRLMKTIGMSCNLIKWSRTKDQLNEN